MKSLKCLGAVTICLLLVLLSRTDIGRAEETVQQKWPPQFPRAGATKVFENDKVIVWDQVYTTDEFMHKHIRQILVIAVQDGPIRVVTPDGKVTFSEQVGAPDPIQLPGVQGWWEPGLGPHSEESTDPKRPRRAFFIEFKGTEPSDCKNWSTACQ